MGKHGHEAEEAIGHATLAAVWFGASMVLLAVALAYM